MHLTLQARSQVWIWGVLFGRKWTFFARFLGKSGLFCMLFGQKRTFLAKYVQNCGQFWRLWDPWRVAFALLAHPLATGLCNLTWCCINYCDIKCRNCHDTNIAVKVLKHTWNTESPNLIHVGNISQSAKRAGTIPFYFFPKFPIFHGVNVYVFSKNIKSSFDLNWSFSTLYFLPLSNWLWMCNKWNKEEN